MMRNTSDTELWIDNQFLHTLGPATKRWALWHITRGCNIECDYCYGSFDGSSYKKNYHPEQDVPITYMLDAADDLARLKFNYVHINGGESFIRRDIWQVIDRLASHLIRVWVLTNATFIPPNFEENFGKASIDTLAFSLDSLRPEYGDKVREKTEAVIKNITYIAGLRNTNRVPTKLGLYVVLTKGNLNMLPELFDWARDIGINYINMQTVYLPKNHKFFPELSLATDDHPIVMEKLHLLQSMNTQIPTSSQTLVDLTNFLMTNNGVVAKNCFANRGDYLYIDGFGNVYGCPSKPPSVNPSWGNIMQEKVSNIYYGHIFEDTTACPFVSLDCLGMYEMAYQEDNIANPIRNITIQGG